MKTSHRTRKSTLPYCSAEDQATSFHLAAPSSIIALILRAVLHIIKKLKTAANISCFIKRRKKKKRWQLTKHLPMKYWNMRLDCLCHSLLAHLQSSSHLTAQNQALSCPHTRCWAHLPSLDSPGPFKHTWGPDRVLPHTAKSANIFFCVWHEAREDRVPLLHHALATTSHPEPRWPHTRYLQALTPSTSKHLTASEQMWPLLHHCWFAWSPS